MCVCAYVCVYIQASMPMVVFLVGVLFATERFTVGTGLNMVVVGTGIAIASYGEHTHTHTHGDSG